MSTEDYTKGVEKYVKEMLKRGYTKEQIKQKLIESNYDNTFIEYLFQDITPKKKNLNLLPIIFLMVLVVFFFLIKNTELFSQLSILESYPAHELLPVNLDSYYSFYSENKLVKKVNPEINTSSTFQIRSRYIIKSTETNSIALINSAPLTYLYTPYSSEVYLFGMKMICPKNYTSDKDKIMINNITYSINIAYLNNNFCYFMIETSVVRNDNKVTIEFEDIIYEESIVFPSLIDIEYLSVRKINRKIYIYANTPKKWRQRFENFDVSIIFDNGQEYVLAKTDIPIYTDDPQENLVIQVQEENSESDINYIIISDDETSVKFISFN